MQRLTLWIHQLTKWIRALTVWFFQQRKRILLIAASTLFALIIAEGIIRIGNFDWKAMGKMMAYQRAYPQVHEVYDDPRVLYRPKTGIGQAEGLFDINSLHYRDPERTAAKKEGVFRIFCFGGSNVFGLGVGNEDTWPRQLEKELMSRFGPGFEVWNGGVCAYVASQAAALAEEALDKYQPDLIIFGISNVGARTFLWGTDIRPFFDKYPDMWAEFFTEQCLPYPVQWDYENRLKLIRTSRLARFLYIARNLKNEKCTWWGNPIHEKNNVAATRELVKPGQERNVPVVLFFFPGAKGKNRNLGDYKKDMDAPILDLYQPGLPKAFRDVHPKPEVTKWYGVKIADWLAEKNLIPVKGAGQ